MPDVRRDSSSLTSSYFAQKQREFNDRRRDFINDLKSHPCMDCGNRFHSAAMDFDHRPGEVKLFTISDRRRGKMSRLLEEVSKCDLICANCHRVRTYERLMEGK